MHPIVALPWWGIQFTSYGLARTAFMFVALWLVVRTNERQGISASATLGAFAIFVPAGILGAHGLDVLEYWGRYRDIPAGELIFAREGSSIYGAFLVVLPAAWVYCRWMNIPALRFFDGGAPAMALGEAMTRIGCFLNGCCYGVPWDGPWAVRFQRESFAFSDQVARGLLDGTSPQSLAVHPAQLYSFALMMLVFAFLLALLRRPHRDGEALFWFLISYGLLRLGMIPFRTENLASMKVFSVCFVVIGTIGLVGIRSSAKIPAAART